MDRRRRRLFLRGSLALAGLGLLSACGLPSPLPRPPAKVAVTGFLAPGTRESRGQVIAAFLEGMRDLGYVEGQHIVMEPRFAEKNDQLPALAAQLVELKVDVLLVGATLGTLAAKQATSTIPIVMAATGEPVATGLVASLAHPGGNVTGMALMSAQTSGKRLELLKETIPSVSRVGVISNETNPLHIPQDQATQDAARALGLQVQILPVRSADDLEGAFEAAARARVDAVYGPTDTTVVSNPRAKLAELALRHRLPTIFDYRESVDAGGLMSYGPLLASVYRHSATHVDKILKGAKPAEIPVEQPTNFELFINAKTARALGLTIPQSVLLQATEVIQ